MIAYNAPERIGTDQGGSVDRRIPYIQRGLVASKINVTPMYIPCDIDHPENLQICPLKLGSTSANGVALFTTVVGWEVASFVPASLAAISALDIHATSIAYVIGNIVSGTRTGSTLKAYICIEAHTSTNPIDFNSDYEAGKWQELTTTTFLSLAITQAGGSKVAHFTYMIEGYQQQ